MAESLEFSQFTKTVDNLEFYPTASASVIDNSIPALAGRHTGPYTCYARYVDFDGHPAVYQFRVTVTTAVQLFDSNGNETQAAEAAVSMREVATAVAIEELGLEEVTVGSEPAVALDEILPRSQANILENEAIYVGDAKIRYGMSAADIDQALSNHTVTGRRQQTFDATEQTMEAVAYDEIGMELVFILNEEAGEKTLIGIAVKSGAAAETTRGIHIGDSEARVREAYSGLINERESTEGSVVVVGEASYGLTLILEQGRVKTIFLGGD